MRRTKQSFLCSTVAKLKGAGTDGQDERGAILLLVLLFMVGIGIIIGSLLTATSAAEVATSAQNTAHADDYAVDGGIEHGIDRLRDSTDTSWCRTVFADTVTVNGATVKITCTPVAGSITSISNWALVSLDPAHFNDLQTTSGATHPVQVLGPTYVEGGMYLQSQLEIDKRCAGNGLPVPSCTVPDGLGSIYQHGSDCSGVTSATTDPMNKGSKLPPIGNWACTNIVPNVNVATPTLPGLPPVPPTGVGTSCTTLYPGTYTAPGTILTPTSYPLPSLTDIQNVYMVSGVYYFKDVGAVDLGGTAKATTIFGGAPSTNESQKISGSGACASDPPGWATLNGTGVEIVLGGNSSINTDKGAMELYTRTPPGASPHPQPSLVTVPANPAPAGSLGQPAAWPAVWMPSNLGGALALQSATGTQPNVAIHGLVYVPDASVSLFGTNNSVGEILGGVVGWDLILQKSASASNFEIATSFSPTVESTVLTASVQYGGKTIKATTKVTVNGDASITVGSWAVNNP